MVKLNVPRFKDFNEACVYAHRYWDCLPKNPTDLKTVMKVGSKLRWNMFVKARNLFLRLRQSQTPSLKALEEVHETYKMLWWSWRRSYRCCEQYFFECYSTRVPASILARWEWWWESQSHSRVHHWLIFWWRNVLWGVGSCRRKRWLWRGAYSSRRELSSLEIFIAFQKDAWNNCSSK